MILTFRYRLLPSRAQHRALEKILESQRQLYNAALQERIEAYRKANVTRTYFDQTAALTEWRREDPEAAAIPATLQRATLKRLDAAYKSFFRRVKAGAKPGFPRFRGKGWFNSFGFTDFCGITLRATRLRFKGMPGALRVHMHRSVLELRAALLRTTERAVGVDLGVTNFATLSDGRMIPSLRSARRAQRRLRIAQRKLARRQPASHGRHKAREEVCRRHAEIRRARANHLHQASARLVRDYDVIAIEALNVKGLAKGILAKDVHDASWATFIALLRYKAERAGARIIEVNPFNTSQECSDCATAVRKKLSERRHVCSHCGLTIDRDLNAALNILHRAGVGPGLRNVADGGMRAGENLGSLSGGDMNLTATETLPVA